MEILEIIAAFFAAFGIYSLLDLLRIRLLYPKHIRQKLLGAVIFDEKNIRDVAAYARYLRLEQKISSERLIILTKGDIINGNCDAQAMGDIYTIIKCKEKSEDGEHTPGCR